MKYARFEQLVLAIGGAAILGTLVFTLPGGQPDGIEVAGHLLLFVILFAAVRFGRNGGLIAAICAAIIYAVLRIPLLSESTVRSAAFIMVVSRLAAFGLLGIVGGDVFSRLKYSLARLEGGSALDEWSRVYNQRYMANALDQARARYTRYAEPVCAIVLELSQSLFGELKPARQRSLVRGIADYVRTDVRMVDEVSRLDDGRFVVLLPHTDRQGGSVVTDRLAEGVRRALGAREESVTVRLLALPEDLVAYSALVDEISVPDEADQSESAAYSDAASITRNPASASALSAAGSSTLNTSTAASPEGSTKQ